MQFQQPYLQETQPFIDLPPGSPSATLTPCELSPQFRNPLPIHADAQSPSQFTPQFSFNTPRCQYGKGSEAKKASDMREKLQPLSLEVTRPAIHKTLRAPPRRNMNYMPFSMRIRDMIRDDQWPPEGFRRQANRSMKLTCDYIYKHPEPFQRLYEANEFAEFGYPYVAPEQPPVVAEGRTDVLMNAPIENVSEFDDMLCSVFDPFMNF
jgi:hypothetical protein